MLAALCLGASVAPTMAAAGPTAKDYQAFIETFFSPENVRDYVDQIDALVDDGSARVFPSAAAVEGGAGPSTRVTKTDVRMTFSIYETQEGLVYHLALSREPHLPRNFAATLVAAFADRAGLMLPTVVKVGHNRVYHVVWDVPGEFVATDKRIVAERRERNRQRTDPEEVFADAAINARNIRVETLIP